MFRKNQSPCLNSEHNRGFTLLETLVLLLIIGILVAVGAPSGLNFLRSQRLYTAQNQIHRAMREAKSNAVKHKSTWQVSIREQDELVQLVVHSSRQSFDEVIWQTLPQYIYLADENTTFYQYPSSSSYSGIYRVQFNYHGNTNGRLGKVTIHAKNSEDIKVCVIVSTLVGGMRTDRGKGC